MDKLKSKLEDRATKQNDFDALVEAAKGRTLNDTEEAQLSKLNDELEAIEKEIKSLEAIEARKKKSAAEKARNGVGAPQDNYSENKELRRYSYAKAFQDVHNRKQGRLGDVQGFEKEIYDEATREAKEAGIEGMMQGNIRVPSWMVSIGGKPKNSAPLTSAPFSVGTEGGDVVETEYRGWLDFLAPEPLLTKLGITILSGLRGNVKWTRDTNELELAWETETGAANELVPTVDAVDLSPHRLAGYTDVTMQMMVQSPRVLDPYIRRKLQNAYNKAIDRTGINGSGISPEPTGILNYSGVNIVSLGSAGGDLGYNALVALMAAPYADNARDGNSGFVFNTNGMQALATTPYQTGGVEGNFILKPETRLLWGHPFVVSNRVPNNLTEGAGSNLSAILFSPRWESFILGTWGGFDILFDPYTQALNGTVRFVVNTFADIDLEHPEEFSAAIDWNTSLPATT